MTEKQNNREKNHLHKFPLSTAGYQYQDRCWRQYDETSYSVFTLFLTPKCSHDFCLRKEKKRCRATFEATFDKAIRKNNFIDAIRLLFSLSSVQLSAAYIYWETKLSKRDNFGHKKNNNKSRVWGKAKESKDKNTNQMHNSSCSPDGLSVSPFVFINPNPVWRRHLRKQWKIDLKQKEVCNHILPEWTKCK